MIEVGQHFLVIRVGQVYDSVHGKYLAEDPIAEVEEVLRQHPTCFFAKFGRELNSERLHDLAQLNRLHLVIAYRSGRMYVSRAYKVIDAPHGGQVNSKRCPPYYGQIVARVGTWLEIVPTPHQPQFSNLIVESSQRNLLSSMALSSSSFFFCKMP